MSADLSEGARHARNEYYKQYRIDHPGNIRRIQLDFWERKAKEKYGKKYRPPADPDTLSEQARELRREYHAQRRANNPSEGKENLKRFWERKAAKNEHIEEAG